MRFTQTCVVLGMLAVPAVASAQNRSEIKEPGNHENYAWELEPHLVVQWNDYAPCTNTGFGPGVRATIPFLDNGPIPKINNNMGIGFGLDWAHSSIGNCAQYRNNNGVFFGNNFSADVWSVPVVVQWNFFLLRHLSVFGEAGLAIEHYRYDNGYYVGCNNNFCSGSYNNTDVNPTFSAGGRFLVSDRFGFLVRLGFPYFSAGLSILL